MDNEKKLNENNRQRWQIPVPEIEEVVERGYDAQIPIPKEYEAIVEDNKVIVKRKKWIPKDGEGYWFVYCGFGENIYYPSYSEHNSDKVFKERYKNGNVFKTKEEAQAVADELSSAVILIFEKYKK